METPNRDGAAEVPVVWLIQEPHQSRDFKSVVGLGQMHTILSKSQNPSVYPETTYQTLRTAFRHAREGDYVLWAGGDPCAAFMAGLVIGELGITGLSWLRWDRHVNEDGGRNRHGYYAGVSIPAGT